MRLFTVLFLISFETLAQQGGLVVQGLQASVEVFRDANGVNHIYATTEHDLFFAQGYCAALDRLFQFEMWRRQATGTLAEILGPREAARDLGARLFKFRGDRTKEFNHYHPRGRSIIEAFTQGINAYIAEANKNPDALPLEFKLLGITPGLWTPDVVISRHQGLLNNITEEIAIAKAVLAIGAEKVLDISNFEPRQPNLQIDPKIAQALLADDLIKPYEDFRKPLTFKPEDVKVAANQNLQEYNQHASADAAAWTNFLNTERKSIGSNNWIVGPRLMQSGRALMANDPHRAITVPSLRYMVHLNAPGWNVIGGGEPTIPGVSIGHNEHGAWGLTVFDIDSEDLYVYELNPTNLLQYRYKNKWENFAVIKDTIRVKGSAPMLVEHLFTRHGPVTKHDPAHGVAIALRCGWLEPGSAPYLASLRIDQATNVQEFLEGCSYSYLPGENMIWADKAGNIAWQAVGIAPIRKNFSGMVPVPGDGRYEWNGYLPIRKLPRVINPEKGFLATANENNVPLKYANLHAVGYSWADPFRVQRINEVLGSGKKFTLTEMKELQFDYLSVPARILVGMLKEIQAGEKNKQALQLLQNWDFTLVEKSPAAALYVAWEKKISESITNLMVPEAARKHIRSVPLSKTLKWLLAGHPQLPLTSRAKFLEETLTAAVQTIEAKQGPEPTTWRYGQDNYHHILIKHPLSNAVDAATRNKLDFMALPRGGYGHTPGMTTSSDVQQAGASFRAVVEAGDWDNAQFTNTPGQSGNPESPFYGNLYMSWATDTHFTVYFSKPLIEKAAVEKTILKEN